MLDFVVSAGGSVAVAPGALRERQVPVRFRVQMKALVCGSRRPSLHLGFQLNLLFGHDRMVLPSGLRALHPDQESDQCLLDQFR